MQIKALARELPATTTVAQYIGETRFPNEARKALLKRAKPKS